MFARECDNLISRFKTWNKKYGYAFHLLVSFFGYLRFLCFGWLFDLNECLERLSKRALCTPGKIFHMFNFYAAITSKTMVNSDYPLPLINLLITFFEIFFLREKNLLLSYLICIVVISPITIGNILLAQVKASTTKPQFSLQSWNFLLVTHDDASLS